jgi:hypothetical protein
MKITFVLVLVVSAFAQTATKIPASDVENNGLLPFDRDRIDKCCWPCTPPYRWDWEKCASPCGCTLPQVPPSPCPIASRNCSPPLLPPCYLGTVKPLYDSASRHSVPPCIVRDARRR